MLKSPAQSDNETTRASAHAGIRAFMRAVESGDATEVRRLTLAGAAPDVPLAGGETALMRAAALGYEDVAVALLDCGADVDARREDGFSPLLLATFRGHADVVRILLERGANAATRTRLGSQGEQWAVAHGFEDIAELLSKAQKEPEVLKSSFSTSGPLPSSDPGLLTDAGERIEVLSPQPDEAVRPHVSTSNHPGRPDHRTPHYRLALPIAIAVVVLGGIGLFSINWRANAPTNSLPPTPPVNGAAGIPASQSPTGAIGPNLQPSPIVVPPDASTGQGAPGTAVTIAAPPNTAPAPSGGPPLRTIHPESSVPTVVSGPGMLTPDGRTPRAGATDPATGRPREAAGGEAAEGRRAESSRPGSDPAQPSQGQGAEIRTAAPSRSLSPPASNTPTQPSPSPSPRKKVIQWP